MTDEATTGVPDDLRWALDVLRAAAPPRAEDEGHYANRALTYLERLEARFTAERDYAPPERRREAYDLVAGALRRLTNCWVRAEVPEEVDPAADAALATLAVLAKVPLTREMPTTTPAPPPRRRLRECVERWPDCEDGAYNPSCCRFPKSCSCLPDDKVADEDLERVDPRACDHVWIDARNAVIASGSYCGRCGTVQTT